MGIKDVRLGITAEDQGLSAGLSQATSVLRDAASEWTKQFTSVEGSLKLLTGGVAGLTAAFGASEIGAQLEHIATRAEGFKEAAAVFNLSTTQLQGLDVMAARTGVSSEQLSRAMTTLETEMRRAGQEGGTAAEKFNALGITTLQLRNPMFTVVDAMAAMGQQSNSNAALLSTVGARSAALIPLMRELAQNHNAAAEAARSVGALTNQEIAILEQYHGQIQNTTSAWQNFQSRLATAVVPAIDAVLGELQRLYAASGRGNLDGLAAAARAVTAEFVKWATAAADLGVDIATLAQAFGTHFGAMGAEMEAAFHGEFARANEIAKEDVANIVQIRKDAEAKIIANHKAMSEALRAIDLSQLQEVTPSVTRQPQMDLLPDLSKETDKMGAEMDRFFAEMHRKAVEQMGATWKVIAESAAESAKVQEAAQVGSIDRQIAAVQELGRTHQITGQQELSQEEALLGQKWTAEQNFFGLLRTLYADNQVELARIDEQQAQAYEKYLTQIQAAQNTASKQMEQQWNSITNGIASAFSKSFMDVLNHTKSTTQAVRGLFASMGESIISTLVKVGVQAMVSAAISKAAGQTAAKSNIMANAAQAASGAFAAVAQIPYVGPVLAPIAAAAAYAGALAFPMAEGGYDVPGGINPVTQLHQKEMVLPAPLAEGLRNIIAGNQAVAAGAGGGDRHVWNVKALDAQSFAQMLASSPGHSNAVARTMMTHARNRGYRV